MNLPADRHRFRAALDQSWEAVTGQIAALPPADVQAAYAALRAVAEGAPPAEVEMPRCLCGRDVLTLAALALGEVLVRLAGREGETMEGNADG